ncbi:hypothetical protein KRR40_43380 [Niabella defluvii]|nr:hypothetical protein KRR40_43380 [Niabella sp. I65]
MFVALMGSAQSPRQITDFNKGWSFILDDDSNYAQPGIDTKKWRELNLPHDWSIEDSSTLPIPHVMQEVLCLAGSAGTERPLLLPHEIRNTI